MMPTMRYSSVSPFASVLDAQRKVLEEVSSAPFEATDGRAGGISYIAPAAPTWVRALVDADGTIDAIETSNHAGLASWVANIRAAADEMTTRIADMLMHVGVD